MSEPEKSIWTLLFPWPVPGLGWAALALLIYPVRVLYSRFADKWSTNLELWMVRRGCIDSFEARDLKVYGSSASRGQRFTLDGSMVLTNRLHLGNLVESIELRIEGNAYSIQWQPTAGFSSREARIIKFHSRDIPWPADTNMRVTAEVKDVLGRLYTSSTAYDLSTY